jgi:hypothetical protein
MINIFVLSLDEKYINKYSEIGKAINKLTYLYIIFFIFFIILILMSIFISNFLLIGEFSLVMTIFMYIDHFIGLIGIATLGIYLSIKNLINLEIRGVFNFE